MPKILVLRGKFYLREKSLQLGDALKVSYYLYLFSGFEWFDSLKRRWATFEAYAALKYIRRFKP